MATDRSFTASERATGSPVIDHARECLHDADAEVWAADAARRVSRAPRKKPHEPLPAPRHHRSLRPEYSSVFVRTINREAGTNIGATFAALVLLFLPSSWTVAIAALAIGFAVLSAPKLYALSVIAITASALLSGSIANPDPVFLSTASDT